MATKDMFMITLYSRHIQEKLAKIIMFRLPVNLILGVY